MGKCQFQLLYMTYIFNQVKFALVVLAALDQCIELSPMNSL